METDLTNFMQEMTFRKLINNLDIATSQKKTMKF
jgi:hypothetical protein